MNTIKDNSFNSCRFCMRTGQLKSLLREYQFNDGPVVYAKMLTECYNISLTINVTTSDQICLDCIRRLKDAVDFKALALEVENRLTDPLQFVTAADFAQDNIKLSIIEELSNEELSLINRFDVSELSLPDVPRSFHRLCERLTGKITGKDLEKLTNENYKKRVKKVGEKTALIHNFNILMKCSNITPFRTKTILGIQCLYCREHKDNIAELKHHYEQTHSTEDNLSLTFWRYGQCSLSINVDITNLKCKLCEFKPNTLKELQNHLSQTHKKRFYMNFPDKIIPYIMRHGDYYCQICRFRFDTFMAVKCHMNKHFCNYICETCGSGFITQDRLRIHVKDVHADKNLTCQTCEKTFKSHLRLKCHVDVAHKNRKRFKCAYCDMRFFDYNMRQLHLVKFHGAKSRLYECKFCDKTFNSNSVWNRHKKSKHSLKKDFQCDLCPFGAITNHELQIHMVKHTGARNFECMVCKKKYARKKTLREHMRIHLDDRRFACEVCGLRFIQKHSLQCHVKSHHQGHME